MKFVEPCGTGEEAMLNKAGYAVLIALTSHGSAFAESKVCYGLVKVGLGWTTVVSDYGDYAPKGCRFRTHSELGRKILAECPAGGECEIIKEVKDWPTGNEPPRPIATITGEAIPRFSPRKICRGPEGKSHDPRDKHSLRADVERKLRLDPS